MPEFFNVLPPDQARALLLAQVAVRTATELVATPDALGRVTAEPIKAPHSLPAFRRSAMDGFAVRAADTFGASEGLPAFVQVVSEVAMGRAASIELAPGQAAIVHTGGMIPESADAVVQVEHTQRVAAGPTASPPFEIEVFRAAAAGQNVLQIGEDVGQGDIILPAGRIVQPQDIGALMALGLIETQVSRQPRVAILATGDEVIEPSQEPEPGQIRDVNSYVIGAMAARAGGEPLLLGIVRDDRRALREAAAAALSQSEMLVITAGSSVSVRDMTADIIDGLGPSGVLLHGIATRPGKPTIAGVIDGKPVLGLPGNPVSALVQFDMLGVPAIRHMLGLPAEDRRGRVMARLGHNIASESGREDYIPAQLIEEESGLIALPIFGKSNLIFTLVNADGLIKVPLNTGGLEAGEQVEVRLF